MHVLVSNTEIDGWLSEQSHETFVRVLVLCCGGGSAGGEEFSDLGQKDELDSDNQSESMRGCEVPRTSHQ